MDHKELGRKLELFSFSRKVPGTVFWWPKGTILFDLIVDDLKTNLKEQGYQDLKTPTIMSLETLKASGHYDNYREKLFFTSNEKEIKKDKLNWCLKPMNCPGSIIIFNEKMRSYKDLPIKFSEVGTVYRYEQPGEVNGLFRTRALTIDDAHIYCREEQIKDEIIDLMDFIKETYARYGFKDFKVELSTRPEKSIGSSEQWRKAEDGLVKALKDKKIAYKENKRQGAFYGPKIDFHVKDSQGRSWQMGTIQLDFATAERLQAFYIDEKGQKRNPVIIHRAILGSIERFIAVLLEHMKGDLPVWLAPVQVRIITIAQRHSSFAQKVADILKNKGIRVEQDLRDLTISKKVREGELDKIPYLCIIGDKEVAGKVPKVAVRVRQKGDIGRVSLEKFEKLVLEQIENKK